MEINANFNNAEVASDSSLKMNETIFYFVDVKKQILNGERKLLILDKDYLFENDRKKYAGSFDPKLPAGNGVQNIPCYPFKSLNMNSSVKTYFYRDCFYFVDCTRSRHRNYLFLVSRPVICLLNRWEYARVTG